MSDRSIDEGSTFTGYVVYVGKTQAHKAYGKHYHVCRIFGAENYYTHNYYTHNYYTHDYYSTEDGEEFNLMFTPDEIVVAYASKDWGFWSKTTYRINQLWKRLNPQTPKIHRSLGKKTYRHDLRMYEQKKRFTWEYRIRNGNTVTVKRRLWRIKPKQAEYFPREEMLATQAYFQKYGGRPLPEQLTD